MFDLGPVLSISWLFIKDALNDEIALCYFCTIHRISLQSGATAGVLPASPSEKPLHGTLQLLVFY